MAWILQLVPGTSSLWGIIMWRGIVSYLSYMGDSYHTPHKKTQGFREQVCSCSVCQDMAPTL